MLAETTTEWTVWRVSDRQLHPTGRPNWTELSSIIETVKWAVVQQKVMDQVEEERECDKTEEGGGNVVRAVLRER
jgi:hypothetical protein